MIHCPCPVQITDLLVNITKHFLEPKYEVLCGGEKEKLLKKHEIEGKQVRFRIDRH